MRMLLLANDPEEPYTDASPSWYLGITNLACFSRGSFPFLWGNQFSSTSELHQNIPNLGADQANSCSQYQLSQGRSFRCCYALLFQFSIARFRGGSPAGSLVPPQFVSRGSYLTLGGRGGNQLCRRQDLASYISIILSFGRLRPP